MTTLELPVISIALSFVSSAMTQLGTSFAYSATASTEICGAAVKNQPENGSGSDVERTTRTLFVWPANGPEVGPCSMALVVKFRSLLCARDLWTFTFTGWLSARARAPARAPRSAAV